IGEPMALATAVPSLASTQGADGAARFVVRHGELELCVIGPPGRSGGAALYRRAGASAWAELTLSPPEFQLVRTLWRPGYAQAASPAPSRGCVATRQLVQELPFQSRYANEENVRQVVRRLRSALDAVGATDLVESSQGRGYYVAWS